MARRARPRARAGWYGVLSLGPGDEAWRYPDARRPLLSLAATLDADPAPDGGRELFLFAAVRLPSDHRRGDPRIAQPDPYRPPGRDGGLAARLPPLGCKLETGELKARRHRAADQRPVAE